ncbi:hypothetical protein DPMN_030479, partial [Dreissena polymorpha]
MKINILTKFHKDWMKTVPSTVYTNKLLTDAHTHTQQTRDITRSHKLTMSLRDSIELDQDIIQRTFLTKFHEIMGNKYLAINVASGQHKSCQKVTLLANGENAQAGLELC